MGEERDEGDDNLRINCGNSTPRPPPPSSHVGQLLTVPAGGTVGAALQPQVDTSKFI